MAIMKPRSGVHVPLWPGIWALYHGHRSHLWRRPVIFRMPAVESKMARDVVMGRQICLLNGTGSNQSASRVREQLIITGSETWLQNPGQIERYLALDL